MKSPRGNNNPYGFNKHIFDSVASRSSPPRQRAERSEPFAFGRQGYINETPKSGTNFFDIKTAKSTNSGLGGLARSPPRFYKHTI